MSKEEALSESQNFYSKIIYSDQNDPESLIIYSRKKLEPIIEIDLDGPDEMNLAFLPELKKLPTEEQGTLFPFVLQSLDEYGGGKCLFAINEADIEEAKKIGFDIKPVFPSGYEWFNNLIYSKPNNEDFQQKFKSKPKELEDYDLITDKQTLISRVKEITELLNKHTTWGNGPAYTEEAMRRRINQKGVLSVAAVNKKTGEIDGFIRRKEGRSGERKFYYSGDLVVKEKTRAKGLAAALMNSVGDKNCFKFGIAGTAELLETYKRYGLSSVAEKPPQLGENTVLVCRLIPKHNKLENYINGLSIAPDITPAPSNTQSQKYPSNYPFFAHPSKEKQTMEEAPEIIDSSKQFLEEKLSKMDIETVEEPRDEKTFDR